MERVAGMSEFKKSLVFIGDLIWYDGIQFLTLFEDKSGNQVVRRWVSIVDDEDVYIWFKVGQDAIDKWYRYSGKEGLGAPGAIEDMLRFAGLIIEERAGELTAIYSYETLPSDYKTAEGKRSRCDDPEVPDDTSRQSEHRMDANEN